MKSIVRSLLVKLAPWSFWESARFEWRMFCLRRLMRRQTERCSRFREVLVNIGAGRSGKEGWVNIDACYATNITLECDCRGKLPLANGCAKGIFTEHFLEHVDYEREVPVLLGEFKRILKPGGVVPDAELYLHAYGTEGWVALEQLRGLSSNHVDPYFQKVMRSKMEVINLVFRQFEEHKFAYDYITLERALSDAGFVEMERSSCGKSRLPEVVIDNPSRAHESLYVEAIKPVT